ncbi:probable TSR1 Protein required for processing of 20S pre-rRNA in the cytoplasm, associates with pre-40S ribosomal particles [Ramularia collo-cygni]|uniref:Probable TSR1 Protein required for processing of 20S pre-rRNA in the cytoplasm, associates with pre-40S ribosomal particles n=1 Tax=Ramularia collo-cygni TaxID=112498 RepID=A0A2D3VEU5_9PEZI|nr:probable TSR1 Protein required for processing of 20S pre-rRNA in the cytoplasm, associates with pre-40S ribosomal particles [Ramularia collo-cygni]CZT24365.1 probable TSR1 Protein required for processing of 20S pre-rRNA in the cytoplasm, associates with pre-40S ribosomal particles [Ramularia collo-cygni]
MAPTPSSHSHRSTTKTTNKPYKTKHASKSSLKNAQKGKVEAWEKGSRKTPHQQVMNKIDRRNQAKQRRQNQHAEREEKGSVFAGRNAAPRIVAVVPLCKDVDCREVVQTLNASVEVESEETPREGLWIPRFKQKLTYLTPSRDLVECLDVCRAADFVLFVLSADEEVDEVGEHLLRCIESQGVSTVLTGVHGLEKVEPAKKRPDVLKSLKSFITHFFAAQEKVHDLSNRQECSNVMRSLCTTMPKGVRWREDRSWMMVEECRWEGEQAVITGVVRGQGLKADRLLQVGAWGDFQIDKITAASLETRPARAKTDEMAVDVPEGEQVLDAPTDEQDDLAELAPEEAVMDDVPTTTVAGGERKAVLLDDHHYFPDDRDDQYVKPKRLPRGTSKYQAAWYLDDVSDSGSDLEDVDDDEEDEDMDGGASVAAGPEDGHFAGPEPTEYGGPSEYPQSEMFLDPAIEDEADRLEEYRKQRRTEAEEDLEFPDEIELSPHVDARERLAKYRGLKSLRTSHWDTEEDRPHEPEDWTRLLEIQDYRAAKAKVLKEARLGGVTPGTRVHIYLRIPQGKAQEVQALEKPTAVFALLRHEHKQSAINISITLSSDYPVPLRSKEELILQFGPRRLVIKPLFSAAGNTPNNVHKFDRYLHPGRTAVATFMGPVCWGSVPCLFFKPTNSAAPTGDAIEDLAQSLSLQKQAEKSSPLELIATGTTLPPSTNRIISKRIILTGHPYKIHKKLVTVRYMFFNDSDVRYFSALQLWTKRGRSGYIKEPLGTHGYFKATFDGRVNPLDSIGVSLYKRVWPRASRPWTGRGQEVEEEVPRLMEVEA